MLLVNALSLSGSYYTELAITLIYNPVNILLNDVSTSFFTNIPQMALLPHIGVLISLYGKKLRQVHVVGDSPSPKRKFTLLFNVRNCVYKT